MLNKNPKNMNLYGDVLTSEEVGEILGIGSNKTYKLLKTGEIKNFKIGRQRKIPKKSLIEYIDRMIDEAVYHDSDT